jgi:RNA polymerase-binding protein DksA
MDEKQLESFRQALVELRARLSDSAEGLNNEALKGGGESSDDLSDVPAEHMADRASDNFVRDLKIGVLENTDAEICDINHALDKIEDGSYGECEECGAEIPVRRLKALPFARLCVSCKEQDEQYNGQGG